MHILKSIVSFTLIVSISGLSANTKVRPSVLCLGEALFDCIAHPECNGWELKKVVETKKWSRFPGGAPANVACAFSKLGGKALFAGALGDDTEGKDLLNLFDELGVNTENVALLKKHPTRQVMVTRDTSGDREFAGFIDGRGSNEFADCYYGLTPSAVDRLLSPQDSPLSAVVMGTLGLVHGPTAEAMIGVADRLKSGVSGDFAPLLVVDVNWRKAFWQEEDEERARKKILRFIQGADLVKLTDQEAKWLLDIDPVDAISDPGALLGPLGVKRGVLVTGGELGASYHMAGVGSGRQPAYNVDVVETTGAGDAFTAGFLLKLLQDKREAFRSKAAADEALDLASAAGALTCCKPGAIAAQPELDEILQLIEARRS